jgi:hypothetical protein
MKKFRFFSVIVVALFVSAWAGSFTYNIPTLNGIISTGQKTGETSKGCVTLNGSSGSYLTSVSAIKGLVDVNQYCKPTTGCRILLYREIGTNQYVLIGSVSVPCGSSFSTSPKTITLPAGTHPSNGRYCISAEVTLLNAAPPPTAPVGTICGISYTSGSATFNWSP